MFNKGEKRGFNIFKKVSDSIKNTYRSFVEKCSGYNPVWKGSVIAALIVYFVFTLYFGVNTVIGFGKILDLVLIEVLAILLLGVLLLGANILIVIIKDLPKKLLAVSTAVVIISVILIDETVSLNDVESLIIVSIILVVEMCLGGAVWALIKGKARVVPSIIVVTTIILNLLGINLIFGSGYGGKEINVTYNSKNIKRLVENNPSKNGEYIVKYLTYGTGKDKRRKEFGEDAEIITNTVNVKPLLGTIEGFNGKRRKLYWGFDERNFPLNGRVWYPEEEGEFPLVLIVHGNHSMEEWSDGGYEYLGSHLASKGYIAVSVDENFLNGSWSGGVGNENDVRGWMLLKHLKLWENWNESHNHIFHKKVDFNNISLIGHSRGGEAVAIAAAFNKLKRYPNDADLKFKFNFNIKSIVAIAPTDGQYKPTGKYTPLENINYLVLQGSHDGDVSSFYGSRQYDRIKFTNDQYYFKSSLYIGKANHGQFNTSWGNKDLSLLDGVLLNKKSLLKGDEQREIAKIYISAFLDTTIKDNKEYMPIFKNYQYAVNWLPETVYMNRFEDSNFKVVSNYDEDIDLTTSTLKGGEFSAYRMYYWREKAIMLRDNINANNSAVYLQWRNSKIKGDNGGAESSYTLSLPSEFKENFKVNKGSSFVFSVGDTGKDFNNNNNHKKWYQFWKKENKTNIIRELDLSVQIIDNQGRISELPASDFTTLNPVIKARFTKLKWLEDNYEEFEPNFQTVIMPMEYFIKENSHMDYNNIKQIKFVFNRVKTGEVMIDDIGFGL